MISIANRITPAAVRIVLVKVQVLLIMYQYQTFFCVDKEQRLFVI
jgi:hypothetical protein